MADSPKAGTELIVETLQVSPASAAPMPSLGAYLVHIYPTGPNMGQRYALGETPVVLGRAEDCDICIRDHSVSRRHARIEASTGGYYVVDLESTNGTFVNSTRTNSARLRDGDNLRIGNCIYRFLTGGNAETQYHEEIYRLTISDGLTGFHNKRYFLEFLGRELARSLRHRRPLALVMFDIDKFKAINDELGHLGGDYTLRELSACLKGNIRKEEVLARYGGEEFAVVLVETSRQGAIDMAERVRRLVEQHPFEYEGTRFRVTVSLGVASISGASEVTAEELIRMADEKLYEAKHAGRNCVKA